LLVREGQAENFFEGESFECRVRANVEVVRREEIRKA